MKSLGVIPARGGSKGIKRKNIKLLNGKPMIQYTIEAAQKSNLDRFVVSTEDEEIKAICEGLGAEVIDRPLELATDAAHAAEAVVDVLGKVDGYDTVMMLQPTSPLRHEIFINEALDVYEKGKYESLISVGVFKNFIWALGLQCPFPINYDPFGRRPRRQDKLTDFVENGAIYIFQANHFMDKKCVIYGRLGFYVMPDEACLEVDTPFTFWLTEQTMKLWGKE